MSSTMVIKLAEDTIYLILLVSAPLLGLALLVGLLVSIFQATTQIQEQTLSFIPKIIVVLISLVIFGPWMLQKLIDFSHNILNNLYRYVG